MRLIDADALLKSMHDYWGENPADIRMVNDAPTVDAVIKYCSYGERKDGDPHA